MAPTRIRRLPTASTPSGRPEKERGEPIADGEPPPAEGSWASEKGATLVEYALLVALIAVVCIGAVTYTGAMTSGRIRGTANHINGKCPDGQTMQMIDGGPDFVCI